MSPLLAQALSNADRNQCPTKTQLHYSYLTAISTRIPGNGIDANTTPIPPGAGSETILAPKLNFSRQLEVCAAVIVRTCRKDCPGAIVRRPDGIFAKASCHCHRRCSATIAGAAPAHTLI